MSKKTTLGRIAVAVILLAIMAAIALATIGVTRPEPPNLSDSNEWTLIKSAAVVDPPLDVHVFYFRHRSTTWDPYDVNENRIVITNSNGGRREFTWPKSNTFAAGWCEIFQPTNRSVAVALFENENAVRVVLFSNDQFRFRGTKDELISPVPLKYEDLDHDGQPEFVARSTSAETKVWRWSEVDGFKDATAQYQTTRAGRSG